MLGLVTSFGGSTSPVFSKPLGPTQPNYLLSVQMHEDKVEVYTSVQVHMREVAGVEQFPIGLLTCI